MLYTHICVYIWGKTLLTTFGDAEKQLFLKTGKEKNFQAAKS